MTGAPPRGLEERLRDTRAKLETDVDLWAATSGSPGGVHLIPLFYLCDGTALLISTPRASVAGRNLLADGQVRLGLGPTRDVVGTPKGLATARARDKVGGRPTVVNEDLIRAARDMLPNPANSVTTIAKILSVPAGTLYNHIPDLKGPGTPVSRTGWRGISSPWRYSARWVRDRRPGPRFPRIREN